MEEIKSTEGHGGQAQAVKVTNKKERGTGQKFFFAVLLAIVAYGAYTLYVRFAPTSKTASVSTVVGSTSRPSFFSDTYYGVFLDNNDVYFGKISKRDGSFVTLDNTFYLRVTQVQQKGKDGKVVDVPSLNLVKLGAELHKPTGKIELQINKIISIQELDPASEVIKVIKEYKATGESQPQ